MQQTDVLPLKDEPSSVCGVGGDEAGVAPDLGQVELWGTAGEAGRTGDRATSHMHRPGP